MLIQIVPLVNLNLYNFHVMLIKVGISCISLCHRTGFTQKTNLYYKCVCYNISNSITCSSFQTL